MQQLELDNILSGSENVLTDRQTDRQTAADAERENMQGTESINTCGRYEQDVLRRTAHSYI